MPSTHWTFYNNSFYRSVLFWRWVLFLMLSMSCIRTYVGMQLCTTYIIEYSPWSKSKIKLIIYSYSTTFLKVASQLNVDVNSHRQSHILQTIRLISFMRPLHPMCNIKTTGTMSVASCISILFIICIVTYVAYNYITPIHTYAYLKGTEYSALANNSNLLK